ncbi:hypothetical protein AGOR_G00068700 [Albula goreensis]|uniref:GP-PDE domain-containing protein n=1 Tax=Albula goreensis TaxID=1534307 RepID=A0A8T3DQG3_9TELE|nr:hypothetical protein AGOR_G00068700 [Albula goreensis]
MSVSMPARDGVCRTCCRGIYSCHWRQRSDRKRRCACCWFCSLSLVFLFALFWMYVCLVTYNDRDDVNWKAFTHLKQWVNWFMVVVTISGVLVTYCFLLLLLALFQAALREPLDLHWLHKVLLFLTVLMIGAAVAGMTLKWRPEWNVVYLSLQATAPFLQLGGVGAVTLLSGFVFQRVLRTRSAVSGAVTMLAFMVVSAPIFLCPIFITSPCLLEKHDLPQKPALVGHRGAPMLAPENTMMSFRKSVECGVTAFETDVQVSMDGVPFLMHDHGNRFLCRTTNSKEAYNHSSQVTWKELQVLNAGSWFLENDPFRTVSSLSEEDRAESGNQTIPSLADLLVLARQHNISVIFDMKNDKVNGSDNDTRRTVDTIVRSNISHELVWWLPPIHRKYVKNAVPGFQHFYANWTKMKAAQAKQLNVKYSALDTESIRELRREGVSVNLYVVNEPWLFSLLWCANASSVTTNACHRFKDMSEPIWRMSPQIYTIVWISVDVGSVVMMVMLFFLQRKRELRRRSAGLNQMELHPFLRS